MIWVRTSHAYQWLLAGLTALTLTVWANDQSPVPAEISVIGDQTDIFPYTMVVDGELKGFTVDVERKVAERLGAKIKFSSYPWARAQQMTRERRVDAISYIGKTPEREEFLIFEEGNILSYVFDAFVINRKFHDSIKFNGDLKTMLKYRLVALRGMVHGEQFDAMPFNLFYVDTPEQVVGTIAKGNYDIGVVNSGPLTYEYYQQKFPKMMNEVELLEPSIAQRPVYIAFTLGREALAKKFGEALTAFKKTEEYQRLLKTYGTKTPH